MSDDLTVGELGRMVRALRDDLQAMVNGINSRLDRVVSTDVYHLQSAHTDQRIAALVQDLQKEIDAREALEAAFEQYQRAELGRREHDRQTRLYQLVVPVLFGILSTGVAVWAVVTE